MKPKENKAGKSFTSYDNCETPPYALDPIDFLLGASFEYMHIWEPAMGRGRMVQAMLDRDWYVYGTNDNFFETNVPSGVDLVVTNPPYSIKYDWVKHCYDIKIPFALLMPVEMIATEKGAKLFANDDSLSIVYTYPRIDFFMPNLGWGGGGAQYPTAWYISGFRNLNPRYWFHLENKPPRKDHARLFGG